MGLYKCIIYDLSGRCLHRGNIYKDSSPDPLVLPTIDFSQNFAYLYLRSYDGALEFTGLLPSLEQQQVLRP